MKEKENLKTKATCVQSSIFTKCKKNTFKIKAKHNASMKNIKRDVAVTLTRKTSRVEQAKCNGQAGASSYCNHVCVCVRVCVCTSTVKASSVWIGWTTREQINSVVLKTFISHGKSLHCYCRMKHLTFLTSHFILNYCASRFQKMGPSATIIRHRFRSALHRKVIWLWRHHSRNGSQSN